MVLPQEYITKAHTEALHAIEAAERRWRSRHPTELDARETLTWLRAARAAWVAGDAGEAAVWYRRATEGLLAIALQNGQATGTFAYYGELAVGAAGLCGHEPTLQRVLDSVRMYTTITRQVRRIGRAAGRPGDLNLAAQAVVSGWAAWLRGAQQDAADLLRMAEREVRIMPSDTRARWQLGRHADLHDAVAALLRLDYGLLRVALRALDAKAIHAFTLESPPTDLVSETVAILAGEWRRLQRDQYNPALLSACAEPGLEGVNGGLTLAAGV